MLALAFTYPLALNLTTHVIGPFRGDNFEYVWKMWWVPHALFERGISPFLHPDVYYPFGYPLAYGEITPSHTFLLAPLTLLVGEIAAYNVAILASIVLSGWFMYLLALRFLGREEGRLASRPYIVLIVAFFVGAAFAFSAYQLARIAGHLPLIDTHWLVLTFIGLDRWLQSRRLNGPGTAWHTARDAVLIGVGFSLSALSSWYYAFMLALLLPVYVLAYGGLRALLTDKRTWFSVVFVGVIVAVMCIPFLLPYLQINAEGAATVPLDEAQFWAASPLDYLLPNARQPLWGAAVQRIVWPFPGDAPYEFMTASIGWVTLVLAFIGWRRTRDSGWRAFKWVMIFAFIFSLGPTLTLGRLPLGVPLPARLLRDLLPFAEGIRSWGRFSVFVMLGASLLAGWGLLSILPRFRQQRVIALGVTALLLFSSWVGPAQLVEVGPRPVDTWLAEQSERFAIMQYPLEEALSGPAMLSTRYHQKPVVFGYGTYFPFLFRERHPELLNFPADEALDLLESWDVRYVLVTTNQLGLTPFTLADVDAQPRLRHVITLENEAVYEFVR